MTLPIPRAVREFWNGIRLIRESLPTLYAVRETLDKLMREVENADVAHMQRQLEAERAAHEETRATLDNEISSHESTRFLHADSTKQLSAERAARKEAERKLDALTRWRLQSEEPCPNTGEWIEYKDSGDRLCSTRLGKNLGGHCRWRFTPESLAAMEKAKSDGK